MLQALDHTRAYQQEHLREVYPGLCGSDLHQSQIVDETEGRSAVEAYH